MATLAPQSPGLPLSFCHRKSEPGHPFHYLVHAPGLSSPSTSCPPGASANKVPAPYRGNKQQNSGSAIIPSSNRLSGQVDYEREQWCEQDVGFTEAAREGHTAEYCGSILGLQWDVGAGCGMWKEQETMGGSTLPARGQAGPWMEESWKSGALPSCQEGWPSSEKGMCLPPCLDTINQNRPPCLQSG